jgi:hypothetical protein
MSLIFSLAKGFSKMGLRFIFSKSAILIQHAQTPDLRLEMNIIMLVISWPKTSPYFKINSFKGALKKEISTPPDMKFIAFPAVKGM